MARTAVQMATNSAFVDDGQPVEAQPKLISEVGIYQPEPIIVASSVVTLDKLRDPSVYMSIDCSNCVLEVISDSLLISNFRAELLANADLINCVSKLSTEIDGRMKFWSLGGNRF